MFDGVNGVGAGGIPAIRDCTEEDTPSGVGLFSRCISLLEFVECFGEDRFLRGDFDDFKIIDCATEVIRMKREGEQANVSRALAIAGVLEALRLKSGSGLASVPCAGSIRMRREYSAIFSHDLNRHAVLITRRLCG